MDVEVEVHVEVAKAEVVEWGASLFGRPLLLPLPLPTISKTFKEKSSIITLSLDKNIS